MTFHTPDLLSTLCFLGIVLSLIFVFLFGVFQVFEPKARVRATLRALLGLTVGLGSLGCVVQSGVLEANPFPGVPLLLGLINLIALAAAFSPLGKRMALGIPVAALVGVQAFRLPLELVLHSWVAQGSIPETMTWSGSNLDIISGILALICAPLANRSKVAAWGFNAVGFVLLLNVMRVAVLSSPLPFAWPVEPPLLLAFHLPYFYIVPVCVSGALFGHVVLTRALLSQKS